MTAYTEKDLEKDIKVLKDRIIRLSEIFTFKDNAYAIRCGTHIDKIEKSIRILEHEVDTLGEIIRQICKENEEEKSFDIHL